MSYRRLAALLLGIGSVLGGLVAWPAASATPPTAHLVKVHVFNPAGGERFGARPAPTTANCTNDPGVTSDAWSPTGWTTEVDSARLLTRTVPTTIQKVGGTASSTDIRSEMQSAFDAWWGAEHQAPKFTVTADTTSTQTRQAADRQDDLLFGKTPGSAIAATYTWRWSDGMVESDVVFSTRMPWGLVPHTDGCTESWVRYDVQSIAEHEFGHVLGLGHASTSDDRWNTMYSYGYTGETLKRTLGSGDALGLATLYD